MRKDYYKILGVEKHASSEEIKKSFHRLAFKHHPDHHADAHSDELFKEINEAYQCLSNPSRRQTYDHSTAWNELFMVFPDPYITAHTSSYRVLLNEEFEITYRYIGEGRFFRKPQNANYVFTSGPVVNHRNLAYGDGFVRETSLTYTLCPRHTGDIEIDEASIEVRSKRITSNKIKLHVEATECFFKKGFTAGNQPLVIRLHKEQFSSNTIYRKTYTYRHQVLVPRSDYAAYYHRIGSVMKGVFAACGFLLFAVKTDHAFIGLLIGSLAGGILCRMMYWMCGVKSKYFYAFRHPAVVDYLEQDYELGNDPANVFVNDNILQRIIMLFR